MPEQSESQKRIIAMLEVCLEDNKKQLDKLEEMSEYLKNQMSDEVKVHALKRVEEMKLRFLETKKKLDRTLQDAIDKQNTLYDNELN